MIHLESKRDTETPEHEWCDGGGEDDGDGDGDVKGGQQPYFVRRFGPQIIRT